ncbi:MAG: hypothetical protein IPN71_07315 [Fibrobacteres bacterium]|nr:hypothetical protein [Fibrobacterota bacterium]
MRATVEHLVEAGLDLPEKIVLLEDAISPAHGFRGRPDGLLSRPWPTKACGF